jgi:hypothetical protein
MNIKNTASAKGNLPASIWFATDLLAGGKNEKTLGTRLNIVVKNAKETKRFSLV